MYPSPLYARAPYAFPRVPKPRQRIRASHGPRTWRLPLTRALETHSLPTPQEDPGYKCPSLGFWVTRWDRSMTNNQPSILSPHTSQGLSLRSRKLSGNFGGLLAQRCYRIKDRTKKSGSSRTGAEDVACPCHPSLAVTAHDNSHSPSSQSHPGPRPVTTTLSSQFLGPWQVRGPLIFPELPSPNARSSPLALHLGVAHLKHRPPLNPVSLRPFSNHTTG